MGKPKDTTPGEVERARIAAVERRRKLEEKYFAIKQTECPDLSCPVERKSDVTGLFWAKSRGEWLVQDQSKGNRTQRHFPPQGNTPEDIEHALLAAMKCLLFGSVESARPDHQSRPDEGEQHSIIDFAEPDDNTDLLCDASVVTSGVGT